MYAMHIPDVCPDGRSLVSVQLAVELGLVSVHQTHSPPGGLSVHRLPISAYGYGAIVWNGLRGRLMPCVRISLIAPRDILAGNVRGFLSAMTVRQERCSARARQFSIHHIFLHAPAVRASLTREGNLGRARSRLVDRVQRPFRRGD